MVTFGVAAFFAGLGLIALGLFLISKSAEEGW